MFRLVAAVVLALGLHLLLLAMIVPGRQDSAPEIAGSREVRVTLARSTPEKEVEREQPPDTVLRPPPLPVAIPEHVAEEPRATPPVRRLPERPPSPRLERVKQSKTVPVKQPVRRRAAPATPRSQPVEDPPVLAKKGDVEQRSVAEAPPLGGRVVEAAPLGIDNPPPAYPPLARRRGWEGRVILSVDVRADGSVDAVRIGRSSSYRLLDEAAAEAVRNWRFKPGTVDGRPAAMEVLVPVNFVLKEGP